MPGGIADIEFRLATLTDNEELVSRVTQHATKRGLLSGVNEALGLFPNTLVRIMINPDSMTSIRTSIFGADKSPSRPSGFETTWDVSRYRVGRLSPVHRLNERMLTKIGGIEKARPLFRAMMGYGDTTGIQFPHEKWMLEYCVQTAESLRLVPACFSGVSASVCVCLGCMTVLQTMRAERGGSRKRGRGNARGTSVQRMRVVGHPRCGSDKQIHGHPRRKHQYDPLCLQRMPFGDGPRQDCRRKAILQRAQSSGTNDR